MFEEDAAIYRRRWRDFVAENGRRLAFQKQQKRKFDKMADELASYGSGQLKRLQWRTALACHPDGNSFLLKDSAQGVSLVMKEQVMLPEHAEFCQEAFMCLRNHCAALGTDAHVAQVTQTVVTPLVQDGHTNRVRFALLSKFAAGGTLEDRVQHRVAPPQALRWVRQICAGLAALHDCKMAHGHLNARAVCFDEDTGGVILGNVNICRSSDASEDEAMRQDLTNVGKLLHLMVTGRQGRTFASASLSQRQRRSAGKGGRGRGGGTSSNDTVASLGTRIPWSNGRTITSLLDTLKPNRDVDVSAHQVAVSYTHLTLPTIYSV